MVVIVYANRTDVTGKALQEKINNNALLRDKKILVNLGKSKFRLEQDYINNNYQIINKVENIKNSVDKKRMFEIFKQNNIKSLDYFDLDKDEDIHKIIHHLQQNKEVVLREGNDILICNELVSFIRNYPLYTHATLKEDKLREYRIIIFKNYPLRIMKKVNLTGDFRSKQENCSFINKRIDTFSRNILNECIKVSRVIGLDLCGIDVMINNDRRIKVIEVNSGMSLSDYSQEILMRKLLSL